jgi:hypothetical protein
MTQFKTLLVFIFAVIANTIFAQIEKGNYSLGGGFGLSIGSSKSNNYQSNYKSAYFSPSINKFITNKWLIGFTPYLSNYSLEGTYSGIFNQKSISKSRNGGYGLGLSSRYFLGNIKKTHFFVDASLYFGKRFSDYSYSSNSPTDTSYLDKSTVFNYNLGIGANIFLNSEIALEPIFNYTKSFYSQENNANQVNLANYYFAVRLNSYINLSQKKVEKENNSYLTKGRKIVGGNVYFSSYDKANTYFIGMNAQFGYFITNNIFFKTQVQWERGSANNQLRNQYLTTAVSGRYYFPINKRFSVYPEFRTSYSLSGNKISDAYDTAEVNIGIGGSYFISRYVALDANFLAYNLTSFQRFKIANTRTSLGIYSVGLLYFIR